MGLDKKSTKYELDTNLRMGTFIFVVSVLTNHRSIKNLQYMVAWNSCV